MKAEAEVRTKCYRQVPELELGKGNSNVFRCVLVK